MSEKIYIGNAKVISTQYGNMTKISMTEKDVNTLSDSINNGWVNLIIKERREPSQSGMTHYLEVDNWKPNKTMQVPAAAPTTDMTDELSVDDLPFSTP